MRLEPDKGKLSSPVLRGPGRSNPARLPGTKPGLAGPLDFYQGNAYSETRPDSVALRCMVAPSTNFPLPASGGILDGFSFGLTRSLS